MMIKLSPGDWDKKPDRRTHARLTPERRQVLPPVRCSRWLPILAAAIAIAAWLYTPTQPFDAPYHRIEKSCPEYAANVPGDTGVSEWCMKMRGY